MKRWIVAVAMTVSAALPALSEAQSAGGPGPGNAPPAMRVKMENVLGDTRAAAVAALDPDHRAAVAAIADRVSARILDRRAAEQEIDALLTPAEHSRLVAVQRKLRSDMAAAMSGPSASGMAGMPGMGPPPGGPPGSPVAERPMDAGRFLLLIWRARRYHGPEPRSSAAP